MKINLKVLDMSHHNAGPSGKAIDFAAIAAIGIRGIIHKATQGVGNVDKEYARRRQAATAAGLLWGAYHFADGSRAAAQVAHFLKNAAPDDETLLALDFEPNGGNTMSLAGARDFLRAIEDATGRKAVLYSGSLIKETLGSKRDAYLGAHRLWLAQYSDAPRVPSAWSAPWLHQFSGDGSNSHGIRVPGVDAAQAGKLDMNTFPGTDDELAAQWSGGAMTLARILTPISRRADPDDAPPAAAVDTPASDAADIEVETVQRRLVKLGYTVGSIDGKWAGMTVGAVASFRHDRGLAGDPVIDDALKVEITKAESEGFTRPIAAARADAAPAEIATKVETVQASRTSKLWAWVLGIPGALTAFVKGIGDNFDAALQSPALNTIKEFAADNVLYIALGVVGVAAAIWWQNNKGEAAGVLAYREGRLP